MWLFGYFTFITRFTNAAMLLYLVSCHRVSLLWISACFYVFIFLSVLQVTAQLHSMEPVIMVTLLHTTARSSPTTPSNMKTL